MMDRVIDGFRFLANMTELERALAQDSRRSRGDDLAALKAEAKRLAGEG